MNKLSRVADIALMAFLGLLATGVGSCILLCVAIVAKALWGDLTS